MSKDRGSGRRQGRGRSKRRKRGSPRVAAPQESEEWLGRIWTGLPPSLRWAVGGLATSLGILTGALSLLPQVSVAAQDPIVPSEALSSPFVVTNMGLIPVHDVVAACYMNHVEGLLRVRGAMSGTGVRDVQSVVEGLINLPFVSPAFAWLSPSQSATTGCNVTRRFTGPKFPIHGITTAEIIVDVGYTPWLLPNWRLLRQWTSTAFRLQPLRGGGFRWLPIPEPARQAYSVRPIGPMRDTLFIDEVPPGIYIGGGSVSIRDYLMP
jgi:hypothetical protein